MIMKRLLDQMMVWIAEEAMPTAFSATPCEPLTAQDLDDLYCLFERHDLAHLVGVALDRRGLLPSGALRDRFVQRANIALYRYETSEYDLSCICEAFEKAQIPYMPLKGAVIRNLYAEAWMRTGCDIDVLVHEQDLDRAIDLLVDTYGYTTDRRPYFHNISLFSQSGVHLELHFNIFEDTPNLDKLLARVWEFATPIDGSCRYQLSNEFTLFYLVAHMARHFTQGGCGLKPLLDLHILRHKLSYDDDILRGMLNDCGIETFYDAMLQLLDVWLAGGTHTALSQDCEHYLLDGGAYGTMAQKHATNKEKHPGMLRYGFRRVFLPYEKLALLYPQLRGKKWMAPAFQIRRWQRLIRNRSFQKGLQEIKIVQGISAEKRDTVVNMLNQLGL